MAANPNPGTNVYSSEPQAPNKYGAPPNNGNRQALNHNNAISTQDFTGRAAATPNAANDLTSPLTMAGLTSAQVITIPPNACTMTLVGSATFNMSEFGTATAALVQYAAIPVGVQVTIDVARQQFLYVAGTGTLSFFFQTL
jgi:hypothetical protein